MLFKKKFNNLQEKVGNLEEKVQNIENNLEDLNKKLELRNSGSNIEKKEWMIKKFWNYIKVSWLFWLQVILFVMFFLILLTDIFSNYLNNIYQKYEIATYICYGGSIIVAIISKLMLSSWNGQSNILSFRWKVSLLTNLYYYKYNINLLIFLLLVFITIYFVLYRIIWFNIHFSLFFVFLLLVTFFALFIEPNNDNIISKKKLIYIISSFYIPLMFSIFILFIPFLIKPYFTDNISRFSIDKNNIIYWNGNALWYVISNNIIRPFNCKNKISKNILNNSTFYITTWWKLHVNNKYFCSWKDKYYQLITGTIHLFIKNKNFILFKNNFLNWQLYWIKLSNITWNIQDLEKIYSDTLNSKYISVHESWRLLFSSLLTLFLFSLTLLFWKAYKKEYNNYKRLLNKLIKIEVLLSEGNIIDDDFTSELKEKIKENPEELLPLLPIDDEKDVDSKLLDKIKNTMEEILKKWVKNS